MKTLQELYNEVLASEELKRNIFRLSAIKKLGAFMKAHGCEGNSRRFQDFCD